MGYFRVPLIHSYNTLHHLNPTILIPKTTFIHSQPKSQLEKPFPDTQKTKFQNEIPLSSISKAKFQLETAFSDNPKAIFHKIFVNPHRMKVQTRLLNYFLTPKM